MDTLSTSRMTQRHRRLATVLLSSLCLLHAPAALANTPYFGTPQVMPGTIEAENFDEGGAGVAYYDTDTTNIGGAYRSTGVDIEAASSGGYNVGWIENGEWLEYSITIPATGTYSLTANVASQSTGGTLTYWFSGATTTNTDRVNFGSTGGWQNWQETESASVLLNAGDHVLRVAVDSNGFNLNAITVTAESTSSGVPYLGTPVEIPGTVEAENFDNGDAYYDITAGNTGGAYRDTDVDIEASSTGSFNLGWVDTGEWLDYTIDVQQAGNYRITTAVASPNTGGSFHYEFSGATSINSVPTNVTSTGGWQNWSSVTTDSLYLNAGEHRVRLVIDNGGFNIDAFTLAAESSNPDLPTSYPGYTGNYSGFNLEVDDRFDAFDPAIWSKSDNHTFGEPQCFFEEEGVQYSNGIMALTIDQTSANWKGYYCGELKTNTTYPYGRIEARIKTPATEVASGFISSLFTYVIDPAEDPGSDLHWRELDIEMEGNGNVNDPDRDKKFQANLIYGDGVWEWWRTREWGAYEDKIWVGSTSEWKVYAIEWTPSHIRWFVDGVQVKELLPQDLLAGSTGGGHIYDAQIPEYEMGLFMNFWIPNDQIQDNFGGNKYRNVYPMKAEYDWFRYYRYNN